jgi:hypothetical protein
MKVLTCKWVYAIKEDLKGNKRYKARLVVGGHRQREGIDFNETFAPVVSYSTIRMLLALATVNNWEVHQMDFVTAFLNGQVEEEIYMAQPNGYNDGTNKVCKLVKSLYGLKQAPRQWNKELHRSMESLGFTRLEMDHSVYVRENLIVAVYVDDCILLSANLNDILVFKKEIMKNYKVKDLGELRTIVGMQWERNRKQKSSFLHQSKYTEDVLKRFKMQDSKAVDTPAVRVGELEQKEFENIDMYQKAVGSLIYLNTCTRPDISFAVSSLARKMSNPSYQDWHAVKRLLRYLKGTKDYGISLGNNNQQNPADPEKIIKVYSDADWAGDIATRRSTSGYLIYLQQILICWGTKIQRVVALSTAEAEYISGSTACQETTWVRNLHHEITKQRSVPHLMIDNQAAIAMSKNNIQHARAKHIDIRYHYIRDLVMNNEITIEYCASNEMIADIMTKPLGRILFEKFREKLRVFRK